MYGKLTRFVCMPYVRVYLGHPSESRSAPGGQQPQRQSGKLDLRVYQYAGICRTFTHWYCYISSW